MNNNLVVVFALIFTGFMANAQFNEYKYVVVPIKFATFKNQNQFKTSTLIKYELVNRGLNVVYSDNLPIDLKSNRCLGLNLDLMDNSRMFATKTILTFTNCDGVEVYRTKEGKSKEKSFEIAYREAIQDAVSSIDTINYAYQGKEADTSSNTTEESVTIPIGNDIKEVKAEKTVTINMANDIKEISKEQQNDVVQEPKSASQEQVSELALVDEPVLQHVESHEAIDQTEEVVQTLYAQSVGEGYQLVDTTPKVVYELKPTTLDNTFLVKGIDEGNGILYMKDRKWILEYESKNGKVVRELNVKF